MGNQMLSEIDAEIKEIYRQQQSLSVQLQTAENIAAGLRAIFDTDQPAELRRGIEWLLKKLGLISHVEGCEAKFVEIVCLLGTWPMLFGFAKQWYDYVDTAHQFCLKLSLDQHLETVLLLKSHIFFDDGKLDDALEFGLSAIDAAKRKGNSVVLARALSHTVTVYLYKGQPAQALTLAKSIDTLAMITEDSPTIAQFYLKLAFFQVYGTATDFAQELGETIEQTERLLGKGINKRSTASWHHNIGLNAWRRGEHKTSLARYQMARDLFAEVGDKTEIAITADIGLIFLTMGELAEADRFFSEAQEKNDKVADFLRGLKIESYLAFLCIARGDLAMADSYTSSALRKAILVNNTSDISRITGNRGILRIHLGDHAGALEDLEFDRSISGQRSAGLACALVNLARLRNLMGYREAGRLCALEALDIAMSGTYRPLQIISLRAVAECSDAATAIDLLNQAIDLAKDSQRLDEAACYLSLAKLQKKASEKQRYWELGATLLRQIGAAQWLEGSTPKKPPLIPLLL
jgi:tetratricopeptide (TPR) repeat protein